MKSIIKKSLQSLLLVPALALGVSVVAPALDSVPVFAQGATSIREGADATGQGTDDGTGSATELLKTVTNTLLFIIGAVAVIMLIYGGFRYVTSGGDSSAVTAAKNTILYAVIGIIVAALAYVIVDFVIDALSNDLG